MFVPVVDQQQQPLMPTTPARARRWIKTGKATAFWKGGIFCVRINVEPSAREIQPTAIGIDPAVKREGSSVISAAHTYLNIQAEARDGIKEAEEYSSRARRTRRGRKTPCRQPRQNRRHSTRKRPPSTRARWQWKVRLARFLCSLFPVSVIVVEDSAAQTSKGKRRWNQRFSPLEVGKHWFYEEISKLAQLKLLQGYETRALREPPGLGKTSKKLAEVWEAHAVDAYVLAQSAVGGNLASDDRRLVSLAPFVWRRRQLHRFQTERGGTRKPYGEALVVHPTWGQATVGGTMDGRLSVHDPETNKRLTQGAKVAECQPLKLLRWRTRLVLLHPSPKKGRPVSSPARKTGGSTGQFL